MPSKYRVVLLAVIAAVLLLGSMLLTHRAGATSGPAGAGSSQKQPRIAEIQKRIGRVPKEVTTSAYVGSMAADERVRVLISFELCDQGGLNQLLADLYDPASPSFHQWLTAKQFGKRFGRSQREIRMATDWLLSQGLSVDLQYTNRLAIAFSGTPGTIERAFNVQMGQYWDSEPSDGIQCAQAAGSLELTTVRVMS